MLKDLTLELLELAARFESERLDQARAREAVGLECFGLAAATILREHQLRDRPLPQWVFADRVLEFRQQCGMLTEREIGIDARLDDRPAQGVQSVTLGVDDLLGREVRERLTAPQRERAAQSRRGLQSIASSQRRPPGRVQALEARKIDGLGVNTERIAPSARHDAGRAECLAQSRDQGVDARERIGWRLRPPEHVGQAVDRHDLAQTEGKNREERALFRRAEFDWLACPRNL